MMKTVFGCRSRLHSIYFSDRWLCLSIVGRISDLLHA